MMKGLVVYEGCFDVSAKMIDDESFFFMSDRGG